ncbi:MAG: cytochrome c oxidase assembly protein [Alphaproteobacteria bacterium]|nr:cytochrome c oxidase assembly protein [Alphaproteobacteria bacterium]
MPGLLLLLMQTASAHSGGAVPIRGVYDWSNLPDLPPGAWVDWSLFPSIVIGCLLFSATYELLAGPLRTRWGLSPVGPTVRDRVLFHGGIAVVFCSLQGPLHELSDVYLFSGHMVQHLLITLVFPPMALLGIPPWMWQPALSKGWVRAVGRVLGHPVTGFLVATGVLYFWHVPAMYDLALEDHDVHVVEHLSFMTAYTIMWWPALSRVDALPALTPGWRMVYLFLNTIPMKGLGAIITVSDYVIYRYYATQPRVFGLDPLTDQRLGGLIMWIPGGLVFWVTIGFVFFTYYQGDIQRHQRPRLTVVDGARGTA